MHDADQTLTPQFHLIRPAPVVPISDGRAGQLLTPRAVECLHPGLNRRALARTRALGLPPQHEVVSGCIMYDSAEIERFLASPAAVRCSIYGRADSLFDPSSTIVQEIGACEDFVLHSGWSRAHTCVEFGPPSRLNAPRRGLQDLLNEAVSGEFDVLVVYGLSHISPNVVDQRHLIRQFKTANVQIIDVCHSRPWTALPIRPTLKPR